MRQVESIPLRNITLSNSRPTIPDTVNALAQSLERIGLIQPVTVQQHPDGYRVVAGNHRVAAARTVGWEEIEAFVLADDDTLENELREIDENLCRAELTPAQRAYSIKRRKEIWEVRSRETGGKSFSTSLSDGRRAGPQHEESFAAATAKSIGATKQSINQHISRAESLGEELLEVTGTSLDKGTELDALKKIPQEERRELIERAKAGEQVSARHDLVAKGESEILAKAKEIRAERTKKLREERVKKISEISKGNAELNTEERFPVIYADPPWRYEHASSESRAIENQYPTMTLDDICQLEIPATEDAILFLWTTSPKLEEGMRVVRDWGFTYRTCAVWDKQKIGMGYYFRQQHEILLVATKGSIPAPEPAARPGSVFSFKRGEHSSKPEEVAEMIEKMYPEFPKLEMFCRSPRKGWSVWGNQSNE